MAWNHLLPAGVLIVIGVAIILNADWLARSIRGAQTRYLPFARSDESVDRPGLLGPITPRQRSWAMRGVAAVALVMAALVIVTGIPGISS